MFDYDKAIEELEKKKKKGRKVFVILCYRSGDNPIPMSMVGTFCSIKYVSPTDGVVLYTKDKKDWYVFGYDEVAIGKKGKLFG